MRTWNIGVALLALVVSTAFAACGDGDGGSEGTGGSGEDTGGRTSSSGGRTGTGGSNDGGTAPGDAGAAGAAVCDEGGIYDFLPPTEDEDPGPACVAYGDCMSEGCGDQYEPAFGPDWASGDLSGGACGPAVPCLEGCGCDETCLTNCLLDFPDCLAYGLAFQGCYAQCAEESDACDEERNQ